MICAILSPPWPSPAAGCEDTVQLLGHFSAGFTLDTYTHITNDMQRGAAEKIGGFMETATANQNRSRLTRRRRAGVR